MIRKYLYTPTKHRKKQSNKWYNKQMLIQNNKSEI